MKLGRGQCKQGYFAVLVLVTVPLLYALLIPNIGISQERQLTLQEAAEEGLVDIIGKGGYLGDKVTIGNRRVAWDRIIIVVRTGDTLLNKNPERQGLVVVKVTGENVRQEGQNWKIYIEPGQKVELKGLWTFCMDADKGSPEAGDIFDVSLNLADWNLPTAQQLLNLLILINEWGLHESEDAQKAVWFYTDGRPAPNETVRFLIRLSGGNPDRPPKDFPRLSNPNAHLPYTGAVVPPELEQYICHELVVVDDTFTLGWGDTIEETLEFPWADKVFTFAVNVPPRSVLSVAVMDCCVAGDIWQAEIYEECALLAVTRGDGSTDRYSPPARATIASGKAMVRVRYVRGVDDWPAGMDVKFWVGH